jgi:Cu/Ag efflux protein CusF
MKKIIAAGLIALLGSFPMLALSADDHAGHGAMHSRTTAESSLSEGTVKKIDKAAGKVTIAHGPLANLNMPAMTMVFRVKEAIWLNQMQPDTRIRFLADTINGSLTIVRFEPVK